MQKSKFIKRALPAALVLASGTVLAQPFVTVDPRALAMGGAGVAVGYVGSAPMFNPALLAGEAKDDFSLVLPQIGFRVSDPEEMIDAVDDFQSSVDDLTAATDAFNATPNVTTLAAMQSAAEVITGAYNPGTNTVAGGGTLDGIDNKPIEGWAGAALVAGMPGETLGWAVVVSGLAAGGGRVIVDPNDANYLIQTSLDATSGTIGDFDVNQVGSQVEGRGIAITEIGLSLAHKFDAFGGLQLGVTPKMLQVTTFDYMVNAATEDFNTDEGTKDDSAFTVDVGVLKELPLGFRVGAVVKNAISNEFDTALGNTIEIKPQVRAGIGYQGDWFVVTADMDLAENDPIGGFDQPTQYLAIGGEFDATFAQLRVGYRNNMAAEGDAEDTVYTAGIGFWLGFHLDIGVAWNDDEVSGALQTGFRW